MPPSPTHYQSFFRYLLWVEEMAGEKLSFYKIDAENGNLLEGSAVNYQCMRRHLLRMG